MSLQGLHSVAEARVVLASDGHSRVEIRCSPSQVFERWSMYLLGGVSVRWFIGGRAADQLRLQASLVFGKAKRMNRC